MQSKSESVKQGVLITNANNASPKSDSYRKYRYERREAMQEFTTLHRTKKCGRVPVGEVQLGIANGLPQLRNLFTCGSIWSCPVCSAKVLSVRTKEVQDAISRWQARGGDFVFQTLTLPQSPSTGLQEAKKAALVALRKLNSGRIAELHKGYSQQGYLRTIEILKSATGWNLHVHFLRFVDAGLTENEVVEWHQRIVDIWSTAISGAGLRKPSSLAQHAAKLADAQPIARYFTKAFDNPSALADNVLGESTGGSSTPWRILDAAIAQSNPKARTYWREYEKATKGLRMLTWSRSIRKELGMGKEASDEIVAEAGEGFAPLVRFDAKSAKILGNRPTIQLELLRLVKNEELEGVTKLLDKYLLDYELTPWFAELALSKNPEPQ